MEQFERIPSASVANEIMQMQKQISAPSNNSMCAVFDALDRETVNLQCNARSFGFYYFLSNKVIVYCSNLDFETQYQAQLEKCSQQQEGQKEELLFFRSQNSYLKKQIEAAQNTQLQNMIQVFSIIFIYVVAMMKLYLRII